MAYKAIVDFKDLQTDHEYKAGDAYPFEGVADEDRVKQLAAPTEQRGALIEEATETVEVVEVKAEKKKSKKSEEKAEKKG